MKIYTKTGDSGQTGLFGGARVGKDHLRVDAYGTVDELNAFVGLLCDQIAEEESLAVLRGIQHRLFTLGAHLASDPDKTLPSPDLQEDDIRTLELEMDRMDAQLPELRHFILPGGHPSVSLSHVCRTVCRRAERLVVALHRESPVDPLALIFLNRLSDYFFVLGRFCAIRHGVEEIKWSPRKSN